MVVLGLYYQVVAQDLNPPGPSISDVNVAVRIRLNGVRSVELPRSGPLGSYLLDEPAVLVILHDPRVRISIRHEDIARRVPGHIGRPAEPVRGCRRRRGVSRQSRFQSSAAF